MTKIQTIRLFHKDRSLKAECFTSEINIVSLNFLLLGLCPGGCCTKNKTNQNKKTDTMEISEQDRKCFCTESTREYFVWDAVKGKKQEI